MNKAQRERKRRYRADWQDSLPIHRLSYPMWLESRIEHEHAHVLELCRLCFHDGQLIEAFRQYISDFETGMQVVERCAMRTAQTTSPSLIDHSDRETVTSAVVSLYRLLESTKQNLNQVHERIKAGTELGKQCDV